MAATIAEGREARTASEGESPKDTVARLIRLPCPRKPAALVDRGLTTVEYAIGIVLVLSIVGLLIKVTSQGWFLDLVKNVVGVVFEAITSGIAG